MTSEKHQASAAKRGIAGRKAKYRKPVETPALNWKQPTGGKKQ